MFSIGFGNNATFDDEDDSFEYYEHDDCGNYECVDYGRFEDEDDSFEYECGNSGRCWNKAISSNEGDSLKNYEYEEYGDYERLYNECYDPEVAAASVCALFTMRIAPLEEAVCNRTESPKYIAEYMELRSAAVELAFQVHENYAPLIKIKQQIREGTYVDISRSEAHQNQEMINQLRAEFITSERNWFSKCTCINVDNMCSSPPLSSALTICVQTIRRLIRSLNIIRCESRSFLSKFLHDVKVGRIISSSQLESSPAIIEAYLRLKAGGDKRTHKQILMGLINHIQPPTVHQTTGPTTPDDFLEANNTIVIKKIDTSYCTENAQKIVNEKTISCERRVICKTIEKLLPYPIRDLDASTYSLLAYAKTNNCSDVLTAVPSQRPERKPIIRLLGLPAFKSTSRTQKLTLN